jgi:retron-type reverse transcriptase
MEKGSCSKSTLIEAIKIFKPEPDKVRFIRASKKKRCNARVHRRQLREIMLPDARQAATSASCILAENPRATITCSLGTIGVVRRTQMTTLTTSTSIMATGTTTIRRIITTTSVVLGDKYKNRTMTQLTIDFEPQPVSGNEIPEQTATVALADLFRAYYDCRKNKRNTMNALAFELNYEENLIQLWKDINENKYTVGRSIAFIVDKPVKREIFAGDFRDRIVHHLLISKTEHLFEKEFIYDSYSCRKGRGTLFGVKRLNRFIRSCSENYTKDCYLLKLDIQGFFMSIDRNILFDMIHELIGCSYHEPDRDILIRLAKMVIMNDCTKNCIVKSAPGKWRNLPPNKSLFGNDPGVGLPIGNYTSQVYANFYLGRLDHFIKSDLGIRYYARYVDDFVIVHRDKDFLKSLIPQIQSFLKDQLKLTLHPKKIVLQDYKKGIKFVGAYLMPGRIYSDKRTKGNFYHLIDQWNTTIRNHQLSPEEIQHFQASANSYLGFMRHYKTFRLRKRIFNRMSARFDRFLQPKNAYAKLIVRK